MFERFEDSARFVVVVAQEEARALRHPAIQGEHLLLGINEQDTVLFSVRTDALRNQVIALLGTGDQDSPQEMAFSHTANRALELAVEEAVDRGHDSVRPAHLLLALLREDQGARDLVEALGRPLQEVVDLADAAAQRSPPHAPEDVHQALREGHPVPVTLGAGPPVGDLGNPRTDSRVLLAMLVANGRAARFLRDHGIDEETLKGLS